MMDPDTAMEAAGAGAKAMTKLGEIIEKMFGPHWTHKQADADAYADQKKLETIRNNPDMEIVYKDGILNARQRSPEELAARAEQRRLVDELRQENNIENILEVAAKELPRTEDVSDEPVDDDWITQFFNIAKDISNEEMQYVWGKILAGEIASPKSFSLRTLDILRKISPEEAQLFQKIVPLVLHQKDDYFISLDKDINSMFDVAFSDILTLDECGLMDSTAISLEYTLTSDTPEYFASDTLIVFIKRKKEDKKEVKFILGVHMLTRAGRELFNILTHGSNEEYINAIVKYIVAHKSKEVSISVHKISFIETTPKGKEIKYEPESLASYP